MSVTNKQTFWCSYLDWIHVGNHLTEYQKTLDWTELNWLRMNEWTWSSSSHHITHHYKLWITKTKVITVWTHNHDQASLTWHDGVAWQFDVQFNVYVIIYNWKLHFQPKINLKHIIIIFNYFTKAFVKAKIISCCAMLMHR